MPVVLTTYPTASFNSYASLEFFKARLDQQLRDYSNRTDDRLRSALIEATEYANIRHAYNGYRKEKGQEHEWPREECYDLRGDEVVGIPLALQKAVCEYAWRSLSLTLMPDPTVDPSGQTIKSIDEKVGPLSTSITYETVNGVRLPIYPAADNLLLTAGLIRRRAGFSVGTLARS